jgi:hypothetical protein
VRKIDVISENIPAEKRTRRGTYIATITVGGSFIDFHGAYELPESALVRETIESRLRAFVGVSISVEECLRAADGDERED